ncbi:hypothetical protein ASE07_08025 [Noviherbaspirillum sp. Root189]|nr:hypothetical protein ASE07_08025 [Noviherbaspirillum sp. Root189]
MFNVAGVLDAEGYKSRPASWSYVDFLLDLYLSASFRCGRNGSRITGMDVVKPAVIKIFQTVKYSPIEQGANVIKELMQ